MQTSWGTFQDSFVNAAPAENDGLGALGTYIFGINQENLNTSPYTADQVNIEETSIRLGQAINTQLWALAMSNYTGSIATTSPDETSNELYPTNGRILINGSNTVSGQSTILQDRIQCHLGWAITLCIISIVLIGAALIPPYMRSFMIKGPHLLLNFSSPATRDNSYIKVPQTGAFLDGPARAKLCKDHKVKLADLHSEEGIGRLVIASISPQAGACGNARVKDRLYM